MTIDQAIEAALTELKAGRGDEAERIFRQILAQQPNHSQTLNLLGVLAGQSGRADAVDWFSKAIAADPFAAEYYSNLGNALRGAGRIEESVAACRRAVEIKPDYAQGYVNLGNALHLQGKFEEAISAVRRGVELRPDVAVAHFNLGIALWDGGYVDEAISTYRRAIALKPDYAEAFSNLGIALQQFGQFDEAFACLERAVVLRPDLANIHYNLGVALREIGRTDRAIVCFERALELDPANVAADSNRVYALHFLPGQSAQSILREHGRWNQRHAEPLKPLIRRHENDPDPRRRLRIGYVSPDFRRHVVGRNLFPLLGHHDRDQFEVYCYSNVRRPDDMTDRIRAVADVWREVLALDDTQCADMIRADKIDVLVDLTLHMEGNRLLVFARKPAPVQVTYLGYCSTTGLSAIDHRFSDRFMDPPDVDLESCYSEKTVRLPDTYWCYQTGGPTPEPQLPPSLKSGHPTFGCLNNFAKVSSHTLDVWRQLLATIPESSLVLYCEPGSHRQAVVDRLAAQGRVEFVERQTWEDYVQTYQRIDVALDPFPYAGGITTCDALWMGVPVVTLAGQTAVGRGGVSLLSNVGLRDWIAHDTAEYLKIAEEKTKDLPGLSELRMGLRQRMQSSALMDGKRFAVAVEAAYRQMWELRGQRTI